MDDHDQISQLEVRHGLKAMGYAEWSHLWLGNPAYRELHGDWNIGWVLEDEDRRIVGFLGNIPVWYEFEGRRILAASSHAWVVEPEYRSAGLVLLDCLLDQEGVDLFVSTTVSAASTPAIEAFECSRVPVGLWNAAAYWITNHRGFVQRRLRQRGYPYARWLSYPVAAAVRLRDWLTSRIRAAADVEVEACVAFDERFQVFWEELRHRHPELLLASRSLEVLDWHYRYLLAADRLWIATVVDGPRILAYAVFDRSARRSWGSSWVRLVDFQSLDGGPDLLPPLLAWALRRCRAEGIHTLECYGRWLEEGELVDRLAPYRRELPSWLCVYRATDPDLAERLAERRAWAPTLFDGDASLVP